MVKKQDLYKRYTSTSCLAGKDEKYELAWSKKYFQANYQRLLPKDKNSKILEVGCGYGRYIKTLLEMGYLNSYGIDLSEEQIQHAKVKLGLSNVETANALTWLEHKHNTYDCILTLDVMEHFAIEDLLELGEKIHNALKPGGELIIQVPNAMSPMNPHIYTDLTHVRAFTNQSTQQLFLQLGFVPSGTHEISPHIYDVKTAVRLILWKFVFKPLLHLLALVLHGNYASGIYTGSFIAVGRKKSSNESIP
jgi:2-polyprenyl-3-methyl-5-hydroxy-6-metoxy-1,4-benzoquinol methylase